MADKVHRNPIRIATTTQEREADAISALKSRELLYNRNNKTLGIVLEDEEGNNYRQIVSGLVDEVNITKNENYETKLKEDIVIDSVTTQADHNGVNWKSQSLFAKTSDGTDNDGDSRQVILLCKQDLEKAKGAAFIGGEMIEVGTGIYSHYQVSMTSTGSRLIKGASTFTKKAKFIIVKYNPTGEYYYGIKFFSGIPANIYFAGWADFPDELKAPTYTEYGDSDLSELIELDDDSDTGTQVVDIIIKALVDYTWEFYEGYETITEVSKNWTMSSIKLSFQNGTISFNNNDSGYYFGSFAKIENSRAYFLGTSSTVTKNGNYIRVSSGSGNHMVIGVDEDNATISITAMSNGNSSNGGLRGLRIVNATTGEIAGATQGINAWSDTTVTWTGIPKGDYYVYAQGSMFYKSMSLYGTKAVEDDDQPTGWVQNGNNSGYDLGYELTVLSTGNTKWYSSSVASNAGYIVFPRGSYENPMLSLNVYGDCSVTLGFTSTTNNSANVRLTRTLDTTSDLWDSSVSKDSSSASSITEVTYSYTGDYGTLATIYALAETGAVNLLYVKLDYSSTGTSAGEQIVNCIKMLPNTGEDGSPHILKPTAILYKADILEIAQNCLNAQCQIELDLSNCTVGGDATDWRTDEDLNTAFQGCNTLRKFVYPKGVLSAGGKTFLNCAYLRYVVFNKECTAIGTGSSWTSANTGCLSGARVSELFLPKELQDWGGYFFAQNNCLKFFFYPANWYIRNGKGPADFGWMWNCFSLARGDFKFYLPSHQTSDGVWATADDDIECYNQWKDVDKTFSGTINVSLSDVMSNVDSLQTTDAWADFVEPYDINEYFTEEEIAAFKAEM